MADHKLIMRNGDAAFRVSQIRRVGAEDHYTGDLEDSLFAPSQIWKVMKKGSYLRLVSDFERKWSPTHNI